MNHPKREEWVPLLFGEANPETKQRLEQHLNSCAECAQEVTAWRRTVGRLDSWKVPKAPRVRDFSFKPVGFAAAAAIMIGMFVVGRFSAPQFDAQKLRAELKSELSAEIQQGFARVASDSSNALANLELHLAAASVGNQKEMAREFVDYISACRAEDRKATEALWEKLLQLASNQNP